MAIAGGRSEQDTEYSDYESYGLAQVRILHEECQSMGELLTLEQLLTSIIFSDNFTFK